jgi:hypothetical protein
MHDDKKSPKLNFIQNWSFYKICKARMLTPIGIRTQDMIPGYNGGIKNIDNISKLKLSESCYFFQENYWETLGFFIEACIMQSSFVYLNIQKRSKKYCISSSLPVLKLTKENEILKINNVIFEKSFVILECINILKFKFHHILLFIQSCFSTMDVPRNFGYDNGYFCQEGFVLEFNTRTFPPNLHKSKKSRNEILL